MRKLRSLSDENLELTNFVRACVRACVRAYVRACVRACVCVCVCVVVQGAYTPRIQP